jgi:hypothetical protein
VALLIALFALMLLAAVAFQMMYVADVETVVNDNFRASQRSYDAAWSGVQEARERLMPTNVPPHRIIGPAALPGAAPGSIVYLRNPGKRADGTVETAASIDPTLATNPYFDNEICHENFVGLGLANPGIGIPCAAGPPAGQVISFPSDAPFTATAGALDYKWVRITQKANNSVNPGGGVMYGLVSGNAGTSNTIPICWDGTNQIPKPAGYLTCDDNPPPGNGAYLKTLYIVTSLAVTPTGARRMAQMEVALDPPFVTNAAVDSQDHVNLNGQLTVNGYDNCNCVQVKTCDKFGKNPGTGAFLCTNPPLYANAPGKTCDASKWAIYSTSSVDNPNTSETLIAGSGTGNNSVCSLGSATAGCTQPPKWPYDIDSLIQKYKTQGGTVSATGSPYNYVCPPPPSGSGPDVYANCGTAPSQVFGIPPFFPPTPVDNPIGPVGMAQQVTYVPGNLKITSSSQGNGILVVDGDLEINGGLQFYGLILVRGVVSFTGGGADKTNIFGAVLAGQSSLVNTDTTLGGSAVINFDSCALTRNTGQRPPNAIAFRELPY